VTKTTGAISPSTALAPTGILRASINLGNPVLAQGTVAEPRGVSVALARELAARLDLPLELLVFTAARDSFAAVSQERADIGFLAIDPLRATEVSFTEPYIEIEGVYIVPERSPRRTPDDVDQPGVRIGVNRGSAYDLHLTRALQHAELVRVDDGPAGFLEQGLDGAAGVRQPLTAWVAAHPGHRVVEPRFMEIRQAMAMPRSRGAEALAYLQSYVAEQVTSGFVDAHR
jgi:polar amino acid transport system substrate-binding protein